MPGPSILSSARDDIARFHMERVGPHSAKAIADKLLDTIELLGDMPELGPLHHDAILAAQGCRKLPVPRVPRIGQIRIAVGIAKRATSRVRGTYGNVPLASESPRRRFRR